MSANAASTASVPSPSCSLDGAPWYSPPVWCSCSGSKFATLAADSAAASVATRVTYERAKCAFSILLVSTIKPVSVSPAPTNVKDWVAAPLLTQVTNKVVLESTIATATMSV